MKTITKLAVASFLALSAAAPAFALDPTELTQIERNTYLSTPDGRPIVRHEAGTQVRAHRAGDAMAQAPAFVKTHEVFSGQYFNERNVQ